MTYPTNRPQEFPHPTLPHRSSYKSSHIDPTLPHKSSYKSSHVLHYLTSRPQEFPHPTLPYQSSTRVPTSYTTPPVVHKSSHILPHQSSTRVSTSYTTSLVVLQEFPHPTLPHQSSYMSSHILHYLTSCPARATIL